MNTFRDKYFALPGDFKDATKFWMKDNTNCSAHAGTAGTPGVCNGDGDGVMEFGAGAGSAGEIYQFWRQLALAGLIEGTYTGLSGTNAFHDDPGVNSPPSKLGQAGWGIHTGDITAPHSTYYEARYGNYLSFGNSAANTFTDMVALRPEEAWNIDTKLDDGKPATGMVYGVQRASCSNAASSSDYDADYLLSSTSIGCALVFARLF